MKIDLYKVKNMLNTNHLKELKKDSKIAYDCLREMSLVKGENELEEFLKSDYVETVAQHNEKPSLIKIGLPDKSDIMFNVNTDFTLTVLTIRVRMKIKKSEVN